MAMTSHLRLSADVLVPAKLSEEHDGPPRGSRPRPTQSREKPQLSCNLCRRRK